MTHPTAPQKVYANAPDNERLLVQLMQDYVVSRTSLAHRQCTAWQQQLLTAWPGRLLLRDDDGGATVDSMQHIGQLFTPPLSLHQLVVRSNDWQTPSWYGMVSVPPFTTESPPPPPILIRPLCTGRAWHYNLLMISFRIFSPIPSEGLFNL